MAWQFDNARPIYTQILEQMQRRIFTGFYSPGARVEPVRELAQEAGVNPNTMQKALSELEREGFLITDRTSGRTVTTDTGLIEHKRQEILDRTISQLVHAVLSLGVSGPELAQRILLEHPERSKPHATDR